MAINLYLVRHGQTWFNKGHRMQGSCDSALTPLGIKQAEAVRDYFQDQGINFARAYCSTPGAGQRYLGDHCWARDGVCPAKGFEREKLWRF